MNFRNKKEAHITFFFQGLVWLNFQKKIQIFIIFMIILASEFQNYGLGDKKPQAFTRYKV